MSTSSLEAEEIIVSDGIETDFKVPKIGRYRLQTVVVLLDSDPRVDLSTGLVLTVLG